MNQQEKDVDIDIDIDIDIAGNDTEGIAEENAEGIAEGIAEENLIAGGRRGAQASSAQASSDITTIQTNEWLLRRFTHKDVQVITQTPAPNSLSIACLNKDCIYKLIDNILYSFEQQTICKQIYDTCYAEYQKMYQQYIALPQVERQNNNNPVRIEYLAVNSKRQTARKSLYLWDKICKNMHPILNHNTEIMFKYDYSLACVLKFSSIHSSIKISPTIIDETGAFSELERLREQSGELGKFIIDHYTKIFTAIRDIIVKKHGIKLALRAKKILLNDILFNNKKATSESTIYIFNCLLACIPLTGSIVDKIYYHFCASCGIDANDTTNISIAFINIMHYINNMYSLNTWITTACSNYKKEYNNANINRGIGISLRSKTYRDGKFAKDHNNTMKFADAIIDLYNTSFVNNYIPHYTYDNIKSHSAQYIYREHAWKRRRCLF